MRNIYKKKVSLDVIGTSYQSHESGVDNQKLIQVNDVIRNHPVEVIGKELRASMTAMKKIV